MRYKGLKGKAWEAVKRSVRRRETDCYTCGKTELLANGLKADAGHYLPVGYVGSNNKLSWNPKLIHLQCARCNGPGQGMQKEYREHLLRDYDEEDIVALESRRYLTDPIKDWQAVIDEFDAL